MNLSMLLLAQGKNEEANQSVAETIRCFPEESEILGMAGYVYLSSGANAAALEALESAMRVRPEDIVILTNFAVALHRADRVVEVRKLLERALHFGPGYAPALENLQLLDHGSFPLKPTALYPSSLPSRE